MKNVTQVLRAPKTNFESLWSRFFFWNIDSMTRQQAFLKKIVTFFYETTDSDSLDTWGDFEGPPTVRPVHSTEKTRVTKAIKMDLTFFVEKEKWVFTHTKNRNDFHSSNAPMLSPQTYST